MNRLFHTYRGSYLANYMQIGIGLRDHQTRMLLSGLPWKHCDQLVTEHGGLRTSCECCFEHNFRKNCLRVKLAPIMKGMHRAYFFRHFCHSQRQNFRHECPKPLSTDDTKINLIKYLKKFIRQDHPLKLHYINLLNTGSVIERSFWVFAMRVETFVFQKLKSLIPQSVVCGS